MRKNKRITREDKEFFESIKHLPVEEKWTRTALKYGNGFYQLQLDKNEK